eukprot:TRINITY_DN9959_c0_g1_i2.p1 TRINITY_DN9959_c0_g1~~TRINITY_DN9959_c0_g1_i2.p1  ORF type:complete len:102 (-),score=8.07 TRINITY_DN9959_c0_g1_i2:119-424(-)
MKILLKIPLLCGAATFSPTQICAGILVVYFCDFDEQHIRITSLAINPLAFWSFLDIQDSVSIHKVSHICPNMSITSLQRACHSCRKKNAIYVATYNSYCDF